MEPQQKQEQAFRDLLKAAEEMLRALRGPAVDAIPAIMRLENAVAKAKEQL